jgi:hypothetical protein
MSTPLVDDLNLVEWSVSVKNGDRAVDGPIKVLQPLFLL